jgi:hypothetical protein
MGCDLDGLFLSAEPTDPVFALAETRCSGDVLTVTALIDSSPLASNLIVELFEEDGHALEPVFPVSDLTQADGQISRWSASVDHDCDDSLQMTWTAHTVQQTTGSIDTHYPDLGPEPDGIDPPYGSTAGGDVVTLTGDWLEDITAVWFGDQEATISKTGPVEAEVFSPSNTEGVVDVEIEGSGGTTTLKGAFTYFADQTDLVRGIGKFDNNYYSEDLLTYDSSYGVIDGSFAQFEVGFHQPTDAAETFWGWFPEVGSCTFGDGISAEYNTVGNYLFLDDQKGDLGQFALPHQDGGAIYYLLAGDITPKAWSDVLFDLSWDEPQDDLPLTSIPGGIMSAPYPDALSLDWTETADWIWGEDLSITFVPDEALVGAIVQPFVTDSSNNTLSNNICVEDASAGALTLNWNDVMADVDATQVAMVYLKVSFYREDLIPFPHDRSLFWQRSLNTFWFVIDIVDPK